MHELSRMVSLGNTYEGFYFKVADGILKLELGDFIPIGNSSNPFKGNFDGNFAEFNLNVDQMSSYNGLFGYFGTGKIKNLSVSGTIKGGSYTGGITGYNNNGVIENVYNMANIEGTTNTGGLVGFQQGTNALVRYAYNIGKVIGTYNVGGFIGNIDTGLVENSYNRGEVIGNVRVGGFVGDMYSGSNRERGVKNSYNASFVSGNSSVSGTIGRYYSGVRTNIYYDLTILKNYVAPNGKIKAPINELGAIPSTEFFNDSLASKGFNSSIWLFKEIEGNIAYYPQLMVFGDHNTKKVKNESLESVKTNPFEGDGTIENPYLIRTAYDMEILANSINEEYDALNIYYEVATDIYELDLSIIKFKPIGSEKYPFRGNFDGSYANFKLDINNNNNYQGLFGSISSESIIKNLSITGSIKGLDYVGSVVGYNEGLIENVYSKTNINANSYVGGLVGYNNGNINLAYNTGNVYSKGQISGGLIGYNNGFISNGYFGGKIQGNSSVGGLVGRSDNSNIESIYYNKTLISFDDILEGYIKPEHAIYNKEEFELGLEKENLTGIEIFDNNFVLFSDQDWTLNETNGLYDFYPQLKSF